MDLGCAGTGVGGDGDVYGRPGALMSALAAVCYWAPSSPQSITPMVVAHRVGETSFNLALGSALASIGLTIPTVAVVSIMMGQPILLGL